MKTKALLNTSAELVSIKSGGRDYSHVALGLVACPNQSKFGRNGHLLASES